MNESTDQKGGRMSADAVSRLMGSLNERFYEETEQKLAARQAEAFTGKGKTRSASFLNSGWFAACVCAVVGIGVYVGLLGLGKGWFGQPVEQVGTHQETNAETEVVTESILCPNGHDTVIAVSHEYANCFIVSTDRYRCSTCGHEWTVKGTEKTTHEYSKGLCVHCGLNEGGDTDFATVRSGGSYYAVLKKGTDTDETEILPTVGLFRDGDTELLVHITGVMRDQDDKNDEAYKGVKKIVIPEGYTMIGEKTFRNAVSLRSVSLPSTLKTISIDAFLNCSALEGIFIPDGCNGIDSEAFRGCTSLSYVHLPESLVFLGQCTFMDCTSLKKIDLPSGLRELRGRNFEGSGLTEVTLPDSLIELNISEFTKTPIRSLYIPDTVTSINGELHDCPELEVLRLPDTITNIPYFRDLPALKTVYLPRDLTDVVMWLPSNNFTNCPSIEEVILHPECKYYEIRNGKVVQKYTGEVLMEIPAAK